MKCADTTINAFDVDEKSEICCNFTLLKLE